MKYKDIITERELEEGPMDWIADKLGYKPKEKPATKVNKAAAADFDFDAAAKNQKMAKPLDITGVKTGSNAADFDFDNQPELKADLLPVQPQDFDKPRPQEKPTNKVPDFKASDGKNTITKRADGGLNVTQKVTDPKAKKNIMKSMDNARRLRRDQMSAGSTDPKVVQAYRLKQAKANKAAIEREKANPNSAWNKGIDPNTF